jgi:hypothetical protein
MFWKAPARVSLVAATRQLLLSTQQYATGYRQVTVCIAWFMVWRHAWFALACLRAAHNTAHHLNLPYMLTAIDSPLLLLVLPPRNRWCSGGHVDACAAAADAQPRPIAAAAAG